MQFSMKLEGLPELQRKLGTTRFRTAIKQGMNKAVVHLEGAIKQRAPHKTGTLKSSFTHQVSGDGTEGRVGSDKIYAPYVEYGTGVYIGKGRIYPRSAKALAWGGKGGPVRTSIAGMKGRFFVKKAWEEEGGAKLIKFFKIEFDEALRKK